MYSRADIYAEQESWRGPLGTSVALHAALAATIVLFGWIGGRGTGELWGGTGGGGGAMGATLVSTIPLPSTGADRQNVLANESKGVSQSLPRQQADVPDAIPIPAKDAKKSYRTQTTDAKTKPVETATNVVPFGQGGPVSGPYGVFSAGAAKGGFGFSGGGGDFGARWGWYVDVVRRKVSENWLKYEIDPSIGSARRVYITFDIAKDGKPGSVSVSQSSGVPALDQSAVRALQRIDTFGPLPSDYPGSRVSVEFWFDYKR